MIPLNMPVIKANLVSAFENNGISTLFTLYDTGKSFSIYAVRGHRRDDPVTDGMNQRVFRVRILADDWHKQCDRAPVKGDQLLMWDRKQAINDVHAVGIVDAPLLYVLIIEG